MDGAIALLTCLVPAAIVLLVVLSAAIKVVQEYERGVIFRLGRLVGPRGPGLFFILPVLDRMVRIDLRTITLEIPPQEIITRDNVTLRVNAVLYFQVVDPSRAVTRVTDFVRATLQIAQTTLRSVLGQSDLDEMLAHREAINQRLQQVIDEQTEPWGIKDTTVEIKDVELPQSMQRAMARQAEAEREKRAKIIHADGEYQASQMLADAARVIGSEPASIQLRYLQTLTEIATERNSTIIFPVPLELLSLIPHVSSSIATMMSGSGPAARAAEHRPEVPAGAGGPELPRPPAAAAATTARLASSEPTAPPPGFAPPGTPGGPAAPPR
jgi:regulator of protease activity HflC (stomatin/prohibitin superfamily)